MLGSYAYITTRTASLCCQSRSDVAACTSLLERSRADRAAGSEKPMATSCSTPSLDAATDPGNSDYSLKLISEGMQSVWVKIECRVKGPFQSYTVTSANPGCGGK